MRKLILIATLHVAVNLFPRLTHGQVQIQSMVPVVGMVQSDQLWNLIIVNSTTGDIHGSLQLSLIDRQTGLEELNASTGSVTLPRGGTSFNATRLAPLTYNYTGMDPSRLLNGMLPAGAYTACYSFLQSAGEKQIVVAEECMHFDVEPLSPPQLIFPQDSAVVDIQPGQFSWIPPTPTQIFSALQYEVMITEVLPGQQQAEAIQENMPFFSTGSIASNVLTYSGSLPSFEKDKWYAWQVVARDDKNFASSSQVWVFKVGKPKDAPVKNESVQYAELRPENEGPAFVTIKDHYLHLSYYSYDSDQDLVFSIRGPGRDILQTVSKKIKYGQNLLQFKLSDKLSEDQIYTLEAETLSKKKLKALFKIVKVQ